MAQRARPHLTMPPLGKQGFSLVEIMVSTALFGMLSLGLADMFAENSQRSAKAQNEAALSEQIVDFSWAFETYLSNVTQFITCNCANNCVLDETVASLATTNAVLAGDCMDTTGQPCGPGATAAPGVTLLRFEYEDAIDPSAPATNANCVMGNLANARLPAATTPESLTLRGCKRRMLLNYVLPTATTPGQLLFYAESPAGAIAAQPAHVLTGVYQFRCGQAEIPPQGSRVAYPDNFRLQLKMKTRSNNSNDVTFAGFESWVKGGANFARGTHRDLDFDVNFHNLDVPGVQFGKTLTYASCVQDGGTAPDGNCCSGFMDSTGKCKPYAQCVTKGNTPSIWSECCSHKTFNGKCI